MFSLLCTLFNTASSAAPQITLCSLCQRAGIEPRTVATLALTARRSDHSISSKNGQISSTNSSRSHPQTRLDSSTNRPDLIHKSARSHPQTRLDLIHSRLDLIHTRLDLIHTRLDLIHKLGQISSTNRPDLIHKVGQISSTLGQISSILGQISFTFGYISST